MRGKAESEEPEAQQCSDSCNMQHNSAPFYTHTTPSTNPIKSPPHGIFMQVMGENEDTWELLVDVTVL